MEKVKDSEKFTKYIKPNQPLKKRTRKEQLVADYLDWFTTNSQVLRDCGILHITDYVREPYKDTNIRAVFKWCKLYLQPLIDELKSVKNMYTPEQWARLYQLDKQHPDIKDYANCRRKVKEMWFKRPRFKADIGRVEKHGY